MRVRLLVSRAGILFAQNAGEVIEVSDGEAKRMIDSQQAEPVGAGGVETASTEPQTEKAVTRGRGRPRKVR